MRAFLDQMAHVIVWVGGIATIVSILGIFVYLFVEVIPLLISPSGEVGKRIALHDMSIGESHAVAVGIDEYQQVAYVLNSEGLTFFELPSGEPISSSSQKFLDQDVVSVVARSNQGPHEFGLGTVGGAVIPMTIELQPSFSEGIREIIPSVTMHDSIQVAQEGDAIIRLSYQVGEEGTALVALTQNRELWLVKLEESSGLMLEDELQMTRVKIDPHVKEPISQLLLDSLGENLFVGLEDGRLVHWDLRDSSNPQITDRYQIGDPGDALTALSYLIGERAFVVGTRSGTVSTWMPLTNFEKGGSLTLQRVHAFTSHPSAVTQLSASRRDKGFVSADQEGNVSVHHSTSAQTLLKFPGTGSSIRAMMFSPKANGVIVLDQSAHLQTLKIDNPHPEISFSTLFLPIIYEGYEQAETIWQSSSGSDDFEPKFGMWPLIFGTLKGTIYAMMLAVPLAVMGAVYTGMFMSPNMRGIVKPIIEIMAALPSVVLGFLAGLWLAPLLEEIIPAVVAMVVVTPIMVAVICLLWHFAPGLPRSSKMGYELWLLMGIVIVSTLGCLAFNEQIEGWVFQSDYKQWLMSVFDLQYDQRNALVISFAMGFAVIPIIFSISEDSISNVPRHLIAGSLAMGATQWQTLTRLVLISASPGIFSALMIGFGRAVGETMIVLMATGNTPILDWSLFNGFRTLSANIAVEMPEAPHGGTLYRVLFLSGLLLFAFTFAINTVAEVVRQRLREKYSQY
jgi:phosphate transport system permease protein